MRFPTGSEAERVSQLDTLLRDQLDAGCVGAILAVDAPRQGVVTSKAAGLFDRTGRRRLLPSDAFRAASVTKAVTAATVVRLASRERWALDDPVAAWLPADVVASLERLRGLPGVTALTIRHLLGHTSGLPCYFFDQQFQARVKVEPDRVWQPNDLVGAAVDTGQLMFPPGSNFSYGDTGYVVLGLAIESLTGGSLTEAYRSLIFDPLEMGDTYLEWREKARGPELSHHYDGDADLRGANISYDWAGGGLVTTAGDLIRFLRGLFGHRLFEAPWLDAMMTWNDAVRWRPHSSARYLRYGLGLGMNRAYGEDIVGVTGVWGAFAYYWPSGDAVCAGTVNTRGADRSALMDAVIEALKHSRSRNMPTD
jgi:D-alanyl-D-alanine carboxypeptidase